MPGNVCGRTRTRGLEKRAVTQDCIAPARVGRRIPVQDTRSDAGHTGLELREQGLRPALGRKTVIFAENDNWGRSGANRRCASLADVLGNGGVHDAESGKACGRLDGERHIADAENDLHLIRAYKCAQAADHFFNTDAPVQAEQNHRQSRCVHVC